MWCFSVPVVADHGLTGAVAERSSNQHCPVAPRGPASAFGASSALSSRCLLTPNDLEFSGRDDLT